MSDLLHRFHPTDLELRGDGRTVFGICVPYDSPAEILEPGRQYVEVFKRGAFARTIAERGPQRVKLLSLHDRQRLPIGRAVSLIEDASGLVGEFRVSATQAGDEALTLIRDGAVDSFSIGFAPVRDEWSRDRSTVERLEVKLREVSVVAFPAYIDAAIAGVRSTPSRDGARARDRDRLHLILREK